MKLALHSFAYALDYLREQIADVAADDMVAQPHGIANHPAWVIGHLTFTCQMLGGAVAGLDPWLPADWEKRYGTGSAPVADAWRYESKETLLKALTDAQGRIGRAVAELDAQRLEAPFPDSAYLEVFPTVRHAIVQVLIGHTSMHVGQLTVWRRAMNLPPMTRSFE